MSNAPHEKSKQCEDKWYDRQYLYHGTGSSLLFLNQITGKCMELPFRQLQNALRDNSLVLLQVPGELPGIKSCAKDHSCGVAITCRRISGVEIRWIMWRYGAIKTCQFCYHVFLYAREISSTDLEISSLKKRLINCKVRMSIGN